VTGAVIGCRACGEIQHLPSQPPRGRLRTGNVLCWRCGEVFEHASGRSRDVALACSLTTLLVLLPANFLTLMTVHVGGISTSTHLASGLATAWRQNWPMVTAVLALQGIVLPFARFGLLSVTLAAIRCELQGRWAGPAFRWSEWLDRWAMLDVLAIGFGVGYGRVATQIPARINVGGWCFLAAALLTLLTRTCLDRRAVWQSISPPSASASPDAIVCPACSLVVDPDGLNKPCPRCGATLHRRRPGSLNRCAALVAASWLLLPAAYGLPMSAFWEAGTPHPHSIIDGIRLLLHAGFWPLAILITVTSLGIPFGKLVAMTWFLTSIRIRSARRLRLRTRLYHVTEAIGRWSNLDPFTVMIFAPMVQFGQIAHIDVMSGSLAFLSIVVLSMVAAEIFDPREMWDAAREDTPREDNRTNGFGRRQVIG
jgi:paraquat-inducible protein A